MRRMLPAPVAELLQFQPVRCRFTVLRRRIIPLFAITALHRNNFSGHHSLLNLRSTCGAGALARDKCRLHVIVFLATLFSHSVYRKPRPSNRATATIANSNSTPIVQSASCIDRTSCLPTSSYCTISEIVPAPTVCPPSRMAKRKPFSMATGVISSITSCTLSPGITISVPLGSSATPVTSVVRK
jgi:hypothetical protein